MVVLSDRKSYASPVELGTVMVGSTMSQVIKSNYPQFSAGDFALSYDGWQAYGVSKGGTLRKLGENFGKLIVKVSDDPTRPVHS